MTKSLETIILTVIRANTRILKWLLLVVNAVEFRLDSVRVVIKDLISNGYILRYS